jgi:hypothetical protein
MLDQGQGGMLLAVEYGRSRWLILDGLDATTSRRALGQGRVPGAQVLLPPLTIKGAGVLSDWLRAANPRLGLWPYADDLGWPEGLDLLRTDSLGWIDLATDGVNFWISSEK